MTQDIPTIHTEHPVHLPENDLSTLSDAPIVAFPNAVQAANVCPAIEIPVKLDDPVARISTYLRCKLGLLRKRADRRHSGFASYIAFFRELLAGPRSVGAVCPSSSYLAQAMAAELDNTDDGLVLELGAGTGSITSALLQRGIAPERLVVVERSTALAAHLRRRFPAVRVIEGDARQLDELLGSDRGRVGAVVSGLPLRSLSHATVNEIARQIHRLLPEGGVFVQFTYDLSKSSGCADMALNRARTRVIWKNLPPARVDTYIQAGGKFMPLPRN